MQTNMHFSKCLANTSKFSSQFSFYLLDKKKIIPNQLLASYVTVVVCIPLSPS